MWEFHPSFKQPTPVKHHCCILTGLSPPSESLCITGALSNSLNNLPAAIFAFTKSGVSALIWPAIMAPIWTARIVLTKRVTLIDFRRNLWITKSFLTITNDLVYVCMLRLKRTDFCSHFMFTPGCIYSVTLFRNWTEKFGFPKHITLTNKHFRYFNFHETILWLRNYSVCEKSSITNA